MSIPPNSPWRGCAANFPQPVDAIALLAAQNLVETIYYFNCRLIFPRLADIIYRSSDNDHDVTHHVYRWDTAPHQQIFRDGFQARRQADTEDNTYYNLNHYVHNAGRPLDSTRPATHAFVSTTLNSGWRPPVQPQPGQEITVYRYEIYAPGGILVAETLGDQYRFPAQDEVSFVAGIARQYIRSAQLFIASRPAGSQFVQWRRADIRLRSNAYFNPQSHPLRLLTIQRPVLDYVVNGTRRPLEIEYYTEEPEKRSQAPSADTIDWYSNRVADSDGYINAAFRARRTNEAYLFMGNQYVLLNYSPGSTNDRIINGPLKICDGYPSLIGTAFGENGIDCAFDTDRVEAFIFSGNLSAYIDYAPGTTNDKILSGPMTIAAMFPFFARTVFENGVDAAFRATARNEAYLFKGDQYALINYNTKRLIAIRRIVDGFYSLRGTIFATGIDAAFASHRKNEAYIFKGAQYALINFAPGSTNDFIIGGPKPIVPNNWPSLRFVLPRKNRGLDTHEHRNQRKAGRGGDDAGAGGDDDADASGDAGGDDDAGASRAGDAGGDKAGGDGDADAGGDDDAGEDKLK